MLGLCLSNYFCFSLSGGFQQGERGGGGTPRAPGSPVRLLRRHRKVAHASSRGACMVGGPPRGALGRPQVCSSLLTLSRALAVPNRCAAASRGLPSRIMSISLPMSSTASSRMKAWQGPQSSDGTSISHPPAQATSNLLPCTLKGSAANSMALVGISGLFEESSIFT